VNRDGLDVSEQWWQKESAKETKGERGPVSALRNHKYIITQVVAHFPARGRKKITRLGTFSRKAREARKEGQAGVKARRSRMAPVWRGGGPGGATGWAAFSRCCTRTADRSESLAHVAGREPAR
jgi:hypothetical protein